MSARSRRKDPDRSRGGANETALYVALSVVTIAAVGLAYLALSGVHIGSQPSVRPQPDTSPASVIAPTTAPTATADPAATTISLVSDTTSAWWAGSVEAGLLPGVSAGSGIGQAGDDIEALSVRLGEASLVPGQTVAVQVGSQDIIEGKSAVDIDASMRMLWQAIRDRGAQPVAVLIGPSNNFPGAVLTINNQIRGSAQEQGITLLDVTSGITTADGSWAPGFSDDGQTPNAAGIEAMTDAASALLPTIVNTSAAAG